MKILTLCLVMFFVGCNSQNSTDSKASHQSKAAKSGKDASDGIEYKSLSVGKLKANCYLVWDAQTLDAIIIDPGGDAKKIFDEAKSLSLKVKGVWATHGHFDHVAAVSEVKSNYAVPFAMHQSDENLLAKIPNLTQKLGMPLAAVPLIETRLQGDEIIKVGNAVGKVIHTPGHSPGSVCFLFGKKLFSGDTLFQNSIGRTDLSGGSRTDIFKSIRSKLLTLDEETVVLPGHGQPTKIGNEKKFNPFLRKKVFKK